MSADLTGYIRAVRLYTERARALYAASIGESYTPPANDDEAITRACEAMIEFARSLVELHEPWPKPADFGIGPEPITIAGCEPDITLGAQPLGQEDKMTDNPTAATIRAAHSNMEAIIAAVIRDQIRIFERETGLEVQGVEVQLATLTSPAGRETLVESVDVRVGLGR